MENKRTSLFPRKNSSGGSSGNRPETFAIEVLGYDTTTKPHTVRGRRLDTQEEVSVSLRKVDVKPNGRFVRSEIADFAAERKDRNHPGTKIGGHLLVQEAFRNEGSFGARWIQVLSHHPGEAQVFIGTVHVSPVKYGKKSDQYPDGRPYSLMTMLHDGNFDYLDEEMSNMLRVCPPFKVESTAELQESLGALMAEGIGLGVRLVTKDDGFDAMYVAQKRDEQKNVDIPGSVADFMKEIESVIPAIDAGELDCEVIPYSNIWAGPATTDMMLENKVTASRVKQFSNEVEKNGKVYQNPVYRKAIVAVRFTDGEGDKSCYFSHFEPLWTREPINGLVNALCHAETERLAPVVPRAAPAQAQGAAPAADSAPPSESFDASEGGPSDLDLMSAAEGRDLSIDDDEPAVQPTTPAATATAGAGRYTRGARMRA